MQKMENCGGKVIREIYLYAMMILTLHNGSQQLVVNKDLPDDLVYNMCKSLWANHDKFVEVKSVWKRVKQEDALKGVAIPVHPGAQKCYDELGVKKG